MRRRVLMVLLWLAGTLGATATVFATVSSVSNDLFDVGNPRNAAPELGRPTGFASTTSTAADQLPTTTAAPVTTTTEPATTTTEPEPTTDTEPVVTEPEVVDTTAPRGGTTVRTTSPAPLPATTVPVATTPPPTTPPVTEPPTSTTPPTSAPSVTCNSPTPKAVGRNVIYYRACTDGLRFSNVVVQTGWIADVSAKGPPSVSVTFSNGSTSLSCTLSPGFDGIVLSSGDC